MVAALNKRDRQWVHLILSAVFGATFPEVGHILTLTIAA